MKRKMFKLVALMLLISITTTAFSACKGPSTDTSTKDDSETTESTTTPEVKTPEVTTPEVVTPELVTLKFFFPGDPVNNMQAVLDEFYNRTKDTLNTKLEFNFIPWGDLTNTLNIKLSAGEDMDCVFDAPWAILNQNIAKGLYQNLDSYMLNDEYPGLKKAFPESYINSNKFVDSTGNMSVYGLPFTHNYAFANCLIIRKDLRVKYGIGEIKSLEDLQTYYDAVIKNEGGNILPFAAGENQSASGIIASMLAPSATFKEVTYVQTGIQFDVAIKDNKAKLYYMGDDYSDFPGAVPPGQAFQIAKEWHNKGYTEKDAITQKDPEGAFKVGKFASVVGDSGKFAAITNDLKKAIPDAETEMIALDPKIANPQPGALKTDYKAWNFQCIPTSSKNADRVMKVMDAIFADESLHDLFEFGIEGKDWELTPENTVKTLVNDQGKAYNFPGFALTWNPAMIKYPDTFTPEVIKIEKTLSDINYFYKDPLAGFSFNAEPVKSDLAKVTPEITKFTTVAGHGVGGDPIEDMKNLIIKCNKLGLQNIKDEATKQINDWLAKNN